MAIFKGLCSITVEPVTFLTFFALMMYQLIRDTGLYRIVCMQKYADQGIDCGNLSGHRQIENEVQRESTIWIMGYGLAVLLPAMISDIILGAWGDRRGRKPNMLLGIVGTVVAVVPLIALLTFPHMPIYSAIFANFICGIMGSSVIVMVSSYAYLADHISDHNLLTTRMAVLSVAITAALISGNYVAGVLLQYLSLAQTLCVVIGVLLLGFFYCLLRIEDKPPDASRPKEAPIEEVERNREPTEKDGLLQCVDRAACTGCCSEISATLRYAGKLLKEVWLTYTQQRVGNHRAYMLIGVVCFHVTMLADFQGNVLTLFLYRSPLSWSPPMLATWKATTGSVTLVGGMIAAVLLKRIMKFRDTTLILLGMACAASQNAVLALSTRTWMVYMSSGFGLFAGISQPTICSLTTRLVRKDEVGKAFAAFTLAAETALILSAVLLNSIYEATIGFYPGFVFFFVTGCVVVAMLPMLWVHVNYDEEDEDRRKRERDEHDGEQTQNGRDNPAMERI